MTVENQIGQLEGIDIGRYSEKIIETMAEALIVIDPGGTILMVNKSFERMFGYKADDIVGKSCTHLNCDLCETEIAQKSYNKWCQLFHFGKDVKIYNFGQGYYYSSQERSKKLSPND